MFRRSLTSLGFLAAVAAPSIAHAGDKPLYAPLPDWVVPAPAIDLSAIADAPVVLVVDNQQRLADGRVSTYVEMATRAASAEVLNQLGTIAIPWMPDKGDLTVHSAEILRASETIDLLKGSERFSVLRREERLEQRMLSGMLTATMAAQGLRVGDVLRVRFTITQADAALKGGVQTMAPVMSEPFRAGFARARISWPVASDVKVRGYAEGMALTPVTKDGFRVVEVKMPLAKQPELPGDLPGRFQRPPLIEATTFTSWNEVSKVMAPLYQTRETIAAGSPLAAEAAKITAAESDPLKRAAAALQLVQDQVRYLLMGMDGGNYIPQSPKQTWELRYGDCKAKSLLLLSILHHMGIEAEAVLVSAQGGDLVTRRLPMPGAFDHVIVRAKIGGRDYWLDGTGMGARFDDLADTPPFRHVLPLREGGAELTPLPTHANARPDAIITTEYDQTAGIDLPSLIRTKIEMRGGVAAMMNAAATQASAKQRRDMVQHMINETVSEAQISEHGFSYDPVSGVATITATGVVTTPWERDQKRLRLPLDKALGTLSFSPDRSRAAWRDIPVATGNPETTLYRTTVKLPADISGFAMEGEPALATTLAGVEIKRQANLANGIVTVEERNASTGIEIAPADIAVERQKVVTAKSRELRLLAPAKIRTRWEGILAAQKSGRLAPLDAAYTKAIAADPEEASGYQSRAAFRSAVFDRRGAIADLTKLIALDGQPSQYLQRASLYLALGEDAKALSDAKEALALDPASDSALGIIASIEADRGNGKVALNLLQERIDLGGKDRLDYVSSKAELLADLGNVAEAIAALDGAIEEKRNDPDLLNSRCWVKGTRAQALDTALKDCTKSIELADSSAAALDSRAMVYYRMGRMDDALADLDAALEESPNMAAALFMRAVVKKKMGDAAGSAHDLSGARLIAPQIDKSYAKYGITI